MMQDVSGGKAKRQLQIAETVDGIKQMLLQKNEAYGDSALTPVRIFSKASPIEQLLVRIDDKLSRITKGIGATLDHEDAINDLIGYLVLLKIARKEELKTSDNLYEKIVEHLKDEQYLDIFSSGVRES